MSENPLLSIPAAAERLGIGRTKCYELIERGEIESVHIDRRCLVVAESIETFVGRLRSAA